MKSFFFKITVLAIVVSIVTTANATRKLCLFGDATRYGWDKGNASPMIQDVNNPSVFYYKAWLKSGSFKFILENTDDSWLPTWNKLNETQIVKRATGADPDEKFNIAEAGNYAVTVDTTNLTFSIVPMTVSTEITHNTIFMIGDATPNGWLITSATELNRDATNDYEFKYSGPMNVGEFKFCVNRNSGWGQDFFTKLSDTQMLRQNEPDNKWSIAEAGNYNITINLQSLAILVEKQTTTNNAEKMTAEMTLQCNIVSDMLWLKTNKSMKYEICAANGVVCQSGFSNTGQINVANLKAGLYIIKANNSVFRFIKR